VVIRRLRTTFAVVILLTLVVAGGVAQRAGAQPAAPPALFSATFLPHGVVRGGSNIETLTLSNTSVHSSSSRLGSADVTIPNGFQVTAFSVFETPFRDRSEGIFGPKDWRVSVSGGALHLRAASWGGGHIDTLQPGQSVTVLLWVESPCNAPDPTTWTTVAGTNSGGSDFSSSSGTPSLRSIGTCGFDLAVRNPQHVGVPIKTTVVAVDGIGLPMPSFNGTAAVGGNLDPSPGGSAPSYNGSLSFSHGVAAFQTLATAYDVETGRQLTVTSGAISGSSNHFNVVGGAAPGQLDFVQQPTDADVSTAIAPAITVDATDQYGNPEPLSSPVTLAIGNDASSGDDANLGGTLTQTPASNLASFGDITIDQPGDGYTLTASAVGFASATSAAFDVTDSCPSGETCQSDGQGTSVVGPEGSEITFGPVAQTFNCDGEDLTSIGSIADIIPPEDTDQSTLTYVIEYSTDVLPKNSDGFPEAPSELCLSKDGGETYFSLEQCGTPIDDDNGDVVGPPCIEDQGFTRNGNGNNETNLGPITGYFFEFEIPADDPHAGGG